MSNNFKTELLTSIDARAAYELNKSSENDNMQRTMRDLRKSFDHEKIAEIMLAANVSADFINKSERVNARYNVYAAVKVSNIARALAKSETLNHFTRAIIASMRAFTVAEIDFTHKDAVAACSLSLKSDKSKQKHLVQYQKHISANTASTQASSTLNALLTFNVIEEYRDMSNSVCYRMRDNDTSKAL